MQGRGCQFGRLDDTRVVRERAKCELRIRYQPSDYSWTNIAGSARKITEKNPVLFLLLTKALDEMFCMWDVMRKDDCPVRLFAQRLAESLYLPFFFCFFSPLFQPLMSALSLGWNRIPLSSAAILSAGFSGTMTSILPDISGEIRIFLKEDISRKRGCRVISPSRSNSQLYIWLCWYEGCNTWDGLRNGKFILIPLSRWTYRTTVSFRVPILPVHYYRIQ